jgi:hypothetical protein
MAATTVGSMKKYFRRLKDPRVVGVSLPEMPVTLAA